MLLPGLPLGIALEPDCGPGMVLLHPDVAQVKASRPQGGQQLVPVVAEGLEPGSGGRADAEHPATEAQGATVGGQLGAGQPGPALPERRQVVLLLPLLLKASQAAGHALRGRGRGIKQDGDATLAATAQSTGHGFRAVIQVGDARGGAGWWCLPGPSTPAWHCQGRPSLASGLAPPPMHGLL